jgi:hypothetical protein
MLTVLGSFLRPWDLNILRRVPQSIATIGICNRIVWDQRDGFVVAGDRFIKTPEFSESVAPIVMDVGIVGPELDSLVVTGNRFNKTPLGRG